MSDTQAPPPGIAIIGMSGRFPGARDLAAFWRNLRDGVESITFFSDQELAAAGVAPALLDDPQLVKAGPILEDVDRFDAPFFDITPREAEITDPQQRIFLECAWAALEDAGYVPDTYAGAIGVYAGAGLNSYLLFHLMPNAEILRSRGLFQLLIGNDKDYLATRVSYKLNLRGPSMNVQTACSTSLVAVALACQSLQDYQTDMALAGGVAIHLPQKAGYRYREGDILSPDGHCRTFDAGAAGTIFGDGMGIVVLKRLADALDDGDHVYAVIRGWAVNNDGAMKVGYTAPGVDGQVGVIAEALSVAEVDAATIGYVEAHGTATPLGDPIEVAALTRVFGAQTGRKGFCALGSVKTNVGHLDTAAGAAGLIKTILALQHGLIPPSLHYETPNPQIDFANSPFYVNARLAPWPAGSTPRRAGVSSFGIGGTNAHLVLEEAPASMPTPATRPWHLLALSAKTGPALEAMSANLAAHLRQHAEQELADLAYTLHVGRAAFVYRWALVCRDREDALAALESGDPQRIFGVERVPDHAPVVFMFPGGGAQYRDMGRELYQTEPLFRAEIDRCAEILRPHLGLDLREVLYPTEQRTKNTEQRSDQPDPVRRPLRGRPTDEPGEGETDQSPISNLQSPISNPLTQTSLALPALFAVEYALARLWMAWGVRPAALIGHSLGEYVAACLAGVFSLADALALVALRGRLFERLPSGAMISVALPEQEARPLLGAPLSLAAINGPAQCVVAGPAEAIDELAAALAGRQVEFRRLAIDVAAHSALVEPILEPFRQFVATIPLRAPAIPCISNVSGTWMTPAQATDPAYWVTHLRQTVRFADGIDELLKEPDRVMLEVGPGQTLSALVRRHPAHAGRAVLASLRGPQHQGADAAFALTTLGRLWLAGVVVDWPALYAGQRRRRVSLPTYPFERHRYWIEPEHVRANLVFATTEPPAPERASAKQPDLADWFYLPTWKRSLPPPPPAAQTTPRRWLVLCDPYGLGQQLVERLEQLGHLPIAVQAGEQFARLADRRYTLDPRRPGHYRDLLASGPPPDGIIHLWSLAADPGEVQTLSFDSLLLLAQALGDQPAPAPLRLTVVASGLHDVTGDEALRPERATLLGPCRVIPQEYPQIACQCINIALPPISNLQSPISPRLLDQLLAEITSPSPDAIIAYRGPHRWVQAFEPLRLEPAAATPARLRERGVYLITGGLGAIGLALAAELARAVKARLALLSRTGPTDEQSAQVRALEELGAEVLVLRADVADHDQMRDALAALHARFGALHGVIHAAGVAGGGVMQLKTPEAAAQVFSPKVAALGVLETVLAGARLDFLALCSSTIAITGGYGQADYCGANAALDTFAYAYAARTGNFAVSINWDGWQQIGLAARTASARRLDRHGPPRIGPLLESCVRSNATEAIYRSRLRPDRDWVLAEHRLGGIAALPGTAYLELARAAFAHYAGDQPVELADVVFHTPLLVHDDGEAEIETVLERAGDGFAFRVLSAPEGRRHASGTIRPIPAAAPTQYPLSELLAQYAGQQVTDGRNDAEPGEQAPTLMPPAGGGLVSWGPRWGSVREAFAREGVGLARLELPAEYQADLEHYVLHPALLDVATAVGTRLAGRGTYLPMLYGRIRVSGPLPAAIYSLVTARPAAQHETAIFDIVLMDDAGIERVSIADFTVKRVDETTFPRPIATPRPAPADLGMTPDEGVEVFRRIIAGCRASQIVVSTNDLAARIAQANMLDQTSILEQLHQARQSSAHARPALQQTYVAPATPIEQQIAEIWQEAFGIAQIGTADDFFELGGNSLLATQVVFRLRDAFQVALPLRLMLETPTIAGLAPVIEDALLAAASPEDLAQALSELELTDD